MENVLSLLPRHTHWYVLNSLFATAFRVVIDLKGERILRFLFNFGGGRLFWKGTVASLSTNRSRRTHVLMSFSTESEQEPILPSILSKATDDRLRTSSKWGLSHTVFVNSALIIRRKSEFSINLVTASGRLLTKYYVTPGRVMRRFGWSVQMSQKPGKIRASSI
jgi:hypothetical protein